MLRAASHPLAATDLSLVRDLAGDRTSTLTVLAHAASWLGRSIVLVPAGVVFALLWRGRPRALLPLTAILGAIVVQNVAKALVDRPRPPVRHLEHVTGTSFPSGHATEAAAFFAALLVAVLPAVPRRPAVVVTLIVVAAVSASRVYLGVHYPTDVAAGAILGAAWTAVLYACTR